MDLFLKISIVIATTYSILIPDLFQQRNTKQRPTLFRTYSNKENTKQRPHLFRTYSNKENTKQQSTIPHLFQQRNTKQQPRTFSNKETQSNDLGRKLGLRLGLIVRRVGEHGLIHCT